MSHVKLKRLKLPNVPSATYTTEEHYI